MAAIALAVIAAAALAWWSWRHRSGQPLALVAASTRMLALVALFLLALDPMIPGAGRRGRALVLLDNSVSMHAAGGPAAAAAMAGSLGDTVPFGEIRPGIPGDQSDLYDPLAGAAASGRPVAIVTDGEISDAGSIPADLLAQATIRVIPRATSPNIAITDVLVPPRLVAGDTLAVEIDALRTAGTPDSAAIEVRDSGLVLLRGTLRFGTGTRGRLQLRRALPRGYRGEHWLTIARIGPADGEPADDQRWRRLVVSPTPGVVVLAETPDFDARELYRTLRDVVDAPIRGYAQLQPGQWRRMDDLRSVPPAEVSAAVRDADLLAVRGDVTRFRSMGRSRILWPEADRPGDWYIAGGGASPVSDAFVGVEPDSLPPAGAVRVGAADSAGEWTGAEARLSRRGAPVAVIAGRRSSDGRTVTIDADGLYRWALRGGVAGQAWRTLIADAASWLLDQPESDAVRARPASAVTERGHAVRFRWAAAGAPEPLPIRVQGDGRTELDTLRFDTSGEASIALPVGRYRYVLNGGGVGSFAVEPFADELIPAPRTVSAHTASTSGAAPRRPVRDLRWLFGVAVIGFAAEWALRRRLGLR